MNAISSSLSSQGDSHFETLSFEPGYISTYVHSKPRADVLIALHACDTASDDSILTGIHLQAQVIVLSPCCHKEIRRQVERHDYRGEGALRDVMSHGIHRERFSEMVTDGLRGLVLEWKGYDVKVFEFVGGEHTGKNCMITAVKREEELQEEERDRIRTRILDLAEGNGVSEFKLADSLGLELRGRRQVKDSRRMPK